MINAKTGTSQGLQGQLGQLPIARLHLNRTEKEIVVARLEGRECVQTEKAGAVQIMQTWKTRVLGPDFDTDIGNLSTWLLETTAGPDTQFLSPSGRGNEEARPTLLTCSKSRYLVLGEDDQENFQFVHITSVLEMEHLLSP